MPKITCPTCGASLEVSDDIIGNDIVCGGCQQQFTAVAEKKKSKRRDDDEDEEDDKKKSKKSKYRRESEDDDDDDDRPRRRGSSSRRDRDDDDDDDDYDSPRKKKTKVSGFAITSLVMGIVSIVIEVPSLAGSFLFSCCCSGWLFWPGHGLAIVCGVIGIIMGFLCMKEKEGKGFWITGMVLSVVSFLLALVGIVISIAFPAMQIATMPPGNTYATYGPTQPGFPPPNTRTTRR